MGQDRQGQVVYKKKISGYCGATIGLCWGGCRGKLNVDIGSHQDTEFACQASATWFYHKFSHSPTSYILNRPQKGHYGQVMCQRCKMDSFPRASRWTSWELEQGHGSQFYWYFDHFLVEVLDQCKHYRVCMNLIVAIGSFQDASDAVFVILTEEHSRKVEMFRCLRWAGENQEIFFMF